MNKYIKLLIESIINEVRILRTIDKKLWLSVASTISRNKATQAEFIKPIGSDKDNMVLRYVAALLITKKPCPTSESDIEKLKTYKLVALKALLLGATLADIQNLYNINSGIVSANTLSQNVLNDIPIEDKIIDTEETSKEDSTDTGFSSIFDDDIFGYDDNEEISNILEPLPSDADINQILLDKFNIMNPRGFGKAFNADSTHPYMYFRRITNGYSYSGDTYGNNLIDLLKQKNWTEYDVNTDFKQEHSDLMNLLYNFLYDRESQNFCVLNFLNYSPLLLPIKFGSHNEEIYTSNILSYSSINEIPPTLEIENKDELKLKNIITYNLHLHEQYLQKYGNNEVIKNLLSTNYGIFNSIYVSPDKGMILYVKKTIGYNRESSTSRTRIYVSYIWDYTLTFTGKVNYIDIVYNKDKHKTNVTKFLNDKKLKQQYKSFLNTVCDDLSTYSDHIFKYIQLKNINIDYDGYPYLLIEDTASLRTYKNTGKHYTNRGNRLKKFGFIELEKSEFKDKTSWLEFKTKYLYAKIIPNKQYGRIYYKVSEIISLTDEGKKEFDKFKK